MPRQGFLRTYTDVLITSAKAYLKLAIGENPRDANFTAYSDTAAINLTAAEVPDIRTQELRADLELYRQRLL